MTLWTITLGLSVAASVSPLLTLMRLWQLKEWRRDRLLEHFQREGFAESLLSRTRILIGGAWIIGGLSITLATVADVVSSELAFRILTPWPLFLAMALFGIGVLQMIRRSQPMPKWTQKACVIFAASIVLTAGIGIACLLSAMMTDGGRGGTAETYPLRWISLTLPYLQPLVLTLAWILTMPLDRFLKNRLMAKARAIRSKYPDLTVIGITGSVGKTTTKELLSHIIAGKGVFTTPEHVNTEMGVSQWLINTLAKPPNHQTTKPETLIVEMGAYRIGEIALLCSIAKPTLGVITGIGEQHVALFGGKKNICQAKGELFESLPATGHAFLNGDSEMCAELKKRPVCPLTEVGTGGNGQLQAYDIEETGRGIKFTVDGTLFDIPLNGTHNVTNALLAIAVAKHVKMPMKDIALRLRTFAPKNRTFEVRTDHGVTILDDTYNSSPQSVDAAMNWSAQRPEKDKILLLSGIIELGAREADIHHILAEKARGIFRKVYVTDERFLPYFKKHFKNDAQPVSAAERLESGTLLACIGRMPKSAIDRLLPQ